MANYIVIGANGFIGTNLTKALSAKDCRVTALVGEGTEYSYLKSLENVDCVEFLLGRMKDISDKIPSDIDGAFFLAWSGVSSSVKNDYERQIANIAYAIEALETLNAFGIKRVVMPGSAAEFSCSDDIINGNNIPAPSDYYSAAKISCRYFCGIYAMQHGMELLFTAISSIYGPGRDDSNLITYTITSLLKGVSPEFTGLEQMWDYIYIDDAIRALILVMRNGKPSTLYPVGSGVARQLSEYVKTIHQLTAPDIPLKVGVLPYKSDKLDSQVLDISNLKNDTGFEPQFSFEEGIKRTIKYYTDLSQQT